MNSSVWVEKYRPEKLDDLIISDKNRRILQSCIDKREIPNITIYGKQPGLGKTTIAKMFGKLFCEKDEVLFINGSLDRNIDTIRNEMLQFVMSASMTGNKKLIIIDEADGLNKASTQNALRGFIEEYSNACSFILTCNNVSNIIQPLLSRCKKFSINVNQEDRGSIAKQIFEKVKHILHENLIEYEDNAIKQIIAEHFPDIREIINTIQLYAKFGKITDDLLIKQSNQISEDYLVDIGTYLIDKNWQQLRIWSHTYYDENSIFEKLYDYIITIVNKDKIAEFITLSGEYSYRDSITKSKEINLAAYLTEITNLF